MTETIKSVSRRRTLVLAGAVTTVAGAALWTHARAADKPADDADAPASGIEELSASDLVGYELRVVKPGQMVTQEYNPGRVTVEVDAAGLITRLYIG